MSPALASKTSRDFIQAFLGMLFLTLPLAALGYVMGYGVDVLVAQLAVAIGGSALVGLFMASLTWLLVRIGWERLEDDRSRC